MNLLVPSWNAPPGVRALCTTRAGGVSSGPYRSLNLGSHVGDEPQAVAANRAQLRVLADLPAEPRWLQQQHGTVVADLDRPDLPAAADAAVASLPNVVCAILTADCLPVLLAARDGSGVAAAHAGWRGLAAGVIEATVGALRAHLTDGQELLAWLGPAIGAANFEVGDDVRDAFLGQDPVAATAFIANRRGRWQCDLYDLARQRLRSLGIEDISGGEHCTYAETSRFFSHRRDVSRDHLPGTGRMATLIWRQGP